MTPELRHLQVSLGAQISYRKAADLLRLLLPPMGGTTHTTTRSRVIGGALLGNQSSIPGCSAFTSGREGRNWSH